LGVDIFAISNGASDHGGFLMKSCWLEDQDINFPTTPKVVINGVTYDKTFIIAQDINITIDDCKMLSVNLTRSNLYYNNCADGAGGTPKPVITKDLSSSVIVNSLRLTDDSYKDYFTKNFIYEQTSYVINYTIVIKTKPRSVISNSSLNVLAVETFADKNSYNIHGRLETTNTQSTNNVVKDGLLFDRCLEISNLPNELGWLDNDILINITSNKYLLWTLDARLVTGDSFSFGIASDGNAFSNDIKVTSKKWSSYMGVGYSKTATLITSLGFRKSLNATARISAFQCLAFDTLQDMIEYAESGIYSNKQTIRNSTSNIIPTAGSYSIGDLIYNTNPTPGGYVGWICTASGTPGTWKGFGLIQV
jgi:hypothetical protein